MKLEAEVRQVIEDGSELSITLRGWASTDPGDTCRRALGTINVPSTEKSRQTYHIGRRVIIDIKPVKGPL